MNNKSSGSERSLGDHKLRSCLSNKINGFDESHRLQLSLTDHAWIQQSNLIWRCENWAAPPAGLGWAGLGWAGLGEARRGGAGRGGVRRGGAGGRSLVVSALDLGAGRAPKRRVAGIPGGLSACLSKQRAD